MVVVNLNPVHGEVYLIQHYVIKFVRDLWQVSGFLRELRFPPPIKLTTTITPVSSTNKTDHHNITKILLKVVLKTINLNQSIKLLFAIYFS